MTEEIWERIAGALQSIARTMELEYQQKYFPPKKKPRDIELSYIPTEEEKLRIEQGQTGEHRIEDWTSLGPREKAFVEAERRTDQGGTDQTRDRS